MANTLKEKRKAYDEAQTNYQTSMQNSTDAERKAAVQSFIQSYENTVNPQSRATKSRRHTSGAGVYEIAQKMLSDGWDKGYDFSSYSAATGLPEYAQIYRRWVDEQRKANTQDKTPTQNVTTDSYHTFNTGSWDPKVFTDDTKFDYRFNQAKNKIQNSITQAKNRGEGVKLVGTNDTALDNALAKLSTATDYNSLMAAIDGLGYNPEDIRKYLGMDTVTNGATGGPAGYTKYSGTTGTYIDQLLGRNPGYSIYTKDGKQYILDSTGKKLEDQYFINTDFSSGDNYEQGYAIKDGQVVFGNMGRYFDTDDNPFYAGLHQTVDSQKNQNRYLINDTNFNPFTYTDNEDYNIFLSQVGDDGAPIVKSQFADVSSYFDSDTPIFVTADNLRQNIDKYGHLNFLGPEALLYKFDPATNKFVKLTDTDRSKFTTTGNKLKSEEDQISYDTEFLKYLDNLKNVVTPRDLATENINGISNMGNLFSAKKTSSILEGLGLDDEKFQSFDQDRGFTSDKNPEDITLPIILSLYKKGQSDRNSLNKAQQNLYENLFDKKNAEHTEKIVAYLYPILKRDIESGNRKYSKYYNTFKDLARYVYGGLHFPASEKNGGIIKALEGTKVSPATKMRSKVQSDIDDLKSLKQRADTEDRSIKQQASAEDTFTWQDGLRVTALIGDIAGLGLAATGAVTGGIGSIAAIGAGIGSTVLDTIADYSDDALSKWDATKNLMLNVGMTAGAAFGAKAPKIIKSIAKILPKVMNVIGASGVVLDPNTYHTLGKVTSGQKLDRNDWANITNVLKLATGLGSQGFSKYGKHGVKKSAAAFSERVDREKSVLARKKIEQLEAQGAQAQPAEPNTYRGKIAKKEGRRNQLQDKPLPKVDSLVDKNKVYVQTPDKKVVAMDKELYTEVNKLVKDGKLGDAEAALSSEANKSKWSAIGKESIDPSDLIHTQTESRGKNIFTKKFWSPQDISSMSEVSRPEAVMAAYPELHQQAFARARAKVYRDRQTYEKNMNWWPKFVNWTERPVRQRIWYPADAIYSYHKAQLNPLTRNNE